MLALKRRKNGQKSAFFHKKKILRKKKMVFAYMPKYWGKQIITHASFPEVGQKQKTEREKIREKD